MIKVEYLLPFMTKDGICKNIKSFNSLLESNSEISIQDKKLRYKGTDYNYLVNINQVPDQDCAVFHVIFEISSVSDKFQEMLKSFRKTVGLHLKDDMQVLWDGLGYEWCKLLYPKIYQTENLMRKVISKFMLINLGIGWQNQAVPTDVKESIKSTRSSIKKSILYEVDFIQLSNFIFKKYAENETSKLPEVIEDLLNGEVTEDKKKEIEKYIPKNNWDRYFSKIVDCESDQLEQKWKKLYEIRCTVAHSNGLSSEDYKKGVELCNYLSLILQKTYDGLNQVEISKDQIENVSLKTLGTINEQANSFVNDYLKFSTGLTGLIDQNQQVFKKSNKYISPISTFLNSSNNGKIEIPDSVLDSLKAIEKTKNIFISFDNLSNLNNIVYRKYLNDASIGLENGIEGLNADSKIIKYFKNIKWDINDEKDEGDDTLDVPILK